MVTVGFSIPLRARAGAQEVPTQKHSTMEKSGSSSYPTETHQGQSWWQPPLWDEPTQAHISAQGLPTIRPLPIPLPEPEVTCGLLTSFWTQQMPTGPWPLSSSTLNKIMKSLAFAQFLQVHEELSFMASVSSLPPGPHNALELCNRTILIPATL